MVNQSAFNCKKLDCSFYEKVFQDLYNTLVDGVAEHRNNLLLACCGIVTFVEYILYGTYTRGMYDVQITGYRPNGTPIYTSSFTHLTVQRILCKGCADGKSHTHALLFQLLVPYQQYSIRYIVYHVTMYLESGLSKEKYCEAYSKEFSCKTFCKWITWINNNMDVLGELGIVKDRTEQKKKKRKWIDNISGRLSYWATRSLYLLNKMLFQRHASPANTQYKQSRIMETVVE